MRTLIVTRGLPGSGKSTILRELGLAPYTLSADAMRLQLASPVLRDDGSLGIDQRVTPDAWNEVNRMLAHRAQEGHFTVIDGVHGRSRDFRYYEQVAEAHGYRCFCLDLSGVDPELAWSRNIERPELEVVPRADFDRLGEQLAGGEVPERFESITPQELMERLYGSEPVDLSGYRQVVHIGDLQGCYRVLEDYLGGRELDPETFYVFVGDFLDRGVENAEIFAWALEHAGRENVVYLYGNHEIHLEDWARSRPTKSREFNQDTRPALEAAGFRRRHAAELIRHTRDYFSYRLGDEQVFCCHAGLPTVPGAPELIPARACWKGTGNYDDPVDDQFTRNAPQGWYQVHGHRNPRLRGIAEPGSRSFNLERQVEFGGELAVLEHDVDGFTPVTVRNRKFAPYRMRMGKNDDRHRGYALPEAWKAAIAEGEAPVISTELLESLRNHTLPPESDPKRTPLIRERVSEAHPHISAFNFSRFAFNNGHFDALTTRARGLFIDNRSGEIIARGYEKFFNIGEPGTPVEDPAAVAEVLTFPVTAYVKENGYLGLLGYSAREDELFFASKAVPAGDRNADFADHFKHLFESQFDEGMRERLRRTLRDQQMCLAFEVIDPEFDPHIIDYDAPRLVLLDAFRRSEDLLRLPHETLQRFADRFSLEAKQRLARFPTPEALEGWHRQAERNDVLVNGAPIEGVVLEGADGQSMVKWKSPYYAFWKQCRSIRDRVLTIRGTQKPLKRNLDRFAGLREFAKWCERMPAEVLSASLPAVRQAYLYEHPEQEGTYLKALRTEIRHDRGGP